MRHGDGKDITGHKSDTIQKFNVVVIDAAVRREDLIENSCNN